MNAFTINTFAEWKNLHIRGKDHYQLKVSPNPSKPGLATITFIVKQQGNIRITLLDQSGNSVENVMDGLHKVGKFEYRIKTNLRPGTYFCQLQAEMIGIAHRFFVAE
ncbi:MAG TPA: hypothetical protein VN038_28620 [Dyadobacter sp.]|nr:hypothetical protein [Dyadobacter sp.]